VDRAALSIARGATRDPRLSRFLQRARSIINFHQWPIFFRLIFLPARAGACERFRAAISDLPRNNSIFRVDRRQTGDGNPYGGPCDFGEWRSRSYLGIPREYRLAPIHFAIHLLQVPASFRSKIGMSRACAKGICKLNGGLPIANNFINRDPISLRTV